ncbi:MAG: LPXTG cell wall anchor domain-containing protein [Lactobacillaceae bacterium]|nr:LPXTG cell wall anchor domain-containing protein [Lactobacillaceae bacterium]
MTKQISQSGTVADNVATDHQEGEGQGLPQTGNSQSILATIMGLITGSLSLLCLRKRHF